MRTSISAVHSAATTLDFCAAVDDAGVEGAALANVGESGDAFDETRHFEYGGMAGGEVDARVRGDAGDAEFEVADAFAGGLVGEPLGGLEDEDGGGLRREFFGDGTRDGGCRFLLH